MQNTEILAQLERVARERLYPPLTNSSWLVLRRRRELFREWIRDLPPRDLRVLDVGGRIQPYRPLLQDRLGSYIGVDLLPNPFVNIVARGEQLPIAGEQFDLVVCTQVLEFVPNPGSLIAEVHRVLKPGGCFFLSVPSVLPQNADYECWRFLPGGLRHLLACFDEVQIVPEGGSVAGFFRTMNVCLSIFMRYPSLRAVFQRVACPVINIAGAMLERLSGSTNDQFAPNYSVRAVKR